MKDVAIPEALVGKMRRDWGLQNVIGVNGSMPPNALKNSIANQRCKEKLANFIARAIYPQQLTIPRQYSTTREGVWIHTILEGREIDGVREDGVRVIVQENAKQARFMISPLFSSKHDAFTWARTNTGA